MEVPTPAKEIIFFSRYEYLHGSELTGRRAILAENRRAPPCPRGGSDDSHLPTDRNSWLAVLTTELAVPVIPRNTRRPAEGQLQGDSLPAVPAICVQATHGSLGK